MFKASHARTPFQDARTRRSSPRSILPGSDVGVGGRASFSFLFLLPLPVRRRRKGMTKEERLRSGESLMSHAMVFTGYDKRDGEEAPNKWRVENRYGGSCGVRRYRCCGYRCKPELR